MMKMLASNFDPLTTSNDTFVKTWTELFEQSDYLNIAVGYASNESILYLKSLMEWNQPKQLKLCIGMAIFDGMYQSQLSALRGLDKLLVDQSLGGVYIANQFPFHGKIQTFHKDSRLFGGLVGSSNLSNIVPPKGTINRGNYEVDLEVTEEPILFQMDSLIEQLIRGAAIPLSIAIPGLRMKMDSNPLLENRFEVEVIESATLNNIVTNLTSDTFEIPLKVAPRSNMNVYFGRGRDNNRGFVAPRPWYEVEIIPGQKVIQSAPNYPDHQDFIVYTDDNYRFVMYTGGDNNKNLRSRGDLTIVGRWLKGRLEMSGALESGDLVDSLVFQRYGRNTMTLTRTGTIEFDELSGENLQVWYADFGVNP